MWHQGSRKGEEVSRGSESMHSLLCFFAHGIVPSRVQTLALGRELSIARKQRKLPDKSRSHLCRYIPVVKPEPSRSSGPLHSSQSIAAKHLCQIPGTFETNRNKWRMGSFSSQGLWAILRSLGLELHHSSLASNSTWPSLCVSLCVLSSYKGTSGFRTQSN